MYNRGALTGLAILNFKFVADLLKLSLQPKLKITRLFMPAYAWTASYEQEQWEHAADCSVSGDI